MPRLLPLLGLLSLLTCRPTFGNLLADAWGGAVGPAPYSVWVVDQYFEMYVWGGAVGEVSYGVAGDALASAFLDALQDCDLVGWVGDEVHLRGTATGTIAYNGTEIDLRVSCPDIELWYGKWLEDDDVGEHVADYWCEVGACAEDPEDEGTAGPDDYGLTGVPFSVEEDGGDGMELGPGDFDDAIPPEDRSG